MFVETHEAKRPTVKETVAAKVGALCQQEEEIKENEATVNQIYAKCQEELVKSMAKLEDLCWSYVEQIVLHSQLSGLPLHMTFLFSFLFGKIDLD